jgi:hypothetical protein
LDKPTVLKDNFGTSAEKPTVLKDDFDKRTVLKDNFGTSAEKPTVLKDDFDKPTVLKDNFGTSAEKPTVLKDNFDKPTVLKDNFDKPTILKDHFEQPTVLKDNDAPTRILTPTPKTVEPKDDLKKQLKLWGSVAAAVCLFGAIFGYCNAQKNSKITDAPIPVAVDTTNTQKAEIAQTIDVPNLDTTAAIAAIAPTSVPATASTATATPAKKVENQVPKTGKPTATAPQKPHNNSEWQVAVAPAPASATPTKPATPETTKVEPAKSEPKMELPSYISNMSVFYKTSLVKELQRLGTDKTLGIGKEKSWTMVFIIESNGSGRKGSERLYCEKCNEAEKNKLLPYLQQSLDFGFPVPLQENKPVAFRLKIEMVNGIPNLKVF